MNNVTPSSRTTNDCSLSERDPYPECECVPPRVSHGIAHTTTHPESIVPDPAHRHPQPHSPGNNNEQALRGTQRRRMTALLLLLVCVADASTSSRRGFVFRPGSTTAKSPRFAIRSGPYVHQQLSIRIRGGSQDDSNSDGMGGDDLGGVNVEIYDAEGTRIPSAEDDASELSDEHLGEDTEESEVETHTAETDEMVPQLDATEDSTVAEEAGPETTAWNTTELDGDEPPEVTVGTEEEDDNTTRVLEQYVSEQERIDNVFKDDVSEQEHATENDEIISTSESPTPIDSNDDLLSVEVDTAPEDNDNENTATNGAKEASLTESSEGVSITAVTNESESDLLNVHQSEHDTPEPRTNDAPTNESDDPSAAAQATMIHHPSAKDKRQEATNLRTEGKNLHDDGDFEEAVTIFTQAAHILDDLILAEQQQQPQPDSLPPTNEDTEATSTLLNNDAISTTPVTVNELAEEASTCRLHGALCELKRGNPTGCVALCTEVLQDEHDPATPPTVTDAVTSTHPQPPNSHIRLPNAVRARAYHRRAKGKLALLESLEKADTSEDGDDDLAQDHRTGALQDAKNAAFLGDRGAVALYGRLMRDAGEEAPLTELGSESGGPTIADMLSNAGASKSPMASLLQSISPSSDDSGSSSSSPLSPLGDMTNLFGNSNPLAALLSANAGNGNESGSGMDMAKTLLNKVTQKLSDPQTQTTLCTLANRANVPQILTLSSLAGVPISEPNAQRIVTFATGITPHKLNRGITLTKRVVRLVQVIRKVLLVVLKYKHWLVYAMLLQFIKSSVNRPHLVVGKRK